MRGEAILEVEFKPASIGGQGMVPVLELANLKKTYGNQLVLKNIDLKVNKGEFVAIVGKSGCGKSTLLRMIAGLEPASEGEARFNGKPVVKRASTIKMMFQDGRLLPWKTVLDNVNLGLKRIEQRKGEALLEQVGLVEKAKNWPGILSGGQRQRVALARALVHEPELLLLDEPLGALDALTRIEMHQLIEKLWLEKKFTAILVTHDVEEAVALANRVIIIEEGVIRHTQAVNLPYPRQRDNPVFTKTVNKILNIILKKDEQTTTEYALKSSLM